ncbi:HRDC domain-containing protein [Nesterenkonia natronophila]|uniref:Ribonuclease D n=1 Tax=Nesterenkonia natronophila TaxID=2174932 RepID=A0A3A4F0U1_9MICC|nr:HRDC domain-containing protein [Nesterenkonia natronophila]RJN31321.1 ribonuclease D [Nesterenkonia natronophila]
MEDPNTEPLPLITEPDEGVPGVIESERGLARAAEALAAGHGPVAVDAERASGFRYGQRAFLVQLKRAGAGIWLIDPEPFSRLDPIQQALYDTEWILHAATQDLPCLAELGMQPRQLFDTELAARLAGLPRVGLGAVVEQLLGVRLAKEHSAADWSRRPLPREWLRYAALDVDLLIPLRDELSARLETQRKIDWAHQEFDHLRTFDPPSVPRSDRWRKTSGLSKLKSPQKLAALRELWNERESLAEKRDVAPTHLLPDRALVAAADALPRTVPQLLAVPGFQGRAAKREARRWLRAIQAGAGVEEFPPPQRSTGVPPPPRTWKDRNPLAFRQFRTARERLARRAAQLQVMPESLLAPAVLKQICWTPPVVLEPDTVATALAQHGARPWQVNEVSAIVTVAMLEPDELTDL